MHQINSWLQRVLEEGGSDLLIAAGSRPMMRLHGALKPLETTRLKADEVRAICTPLLGDAAMQQLERDKNLDLALTVPLNGSQVRFRGAAYLQRSGMNLVMRAIREVVPTLEELQLPTAHTALVENHQGLIMLTGPAGCGKTSTMAALLNHINKTRPVHIITVEDPVEYIHDCDQALINQRQVGVHVDTFATALKAALREDPDVIAIGELRDLETTSLAITAAETGHLVLATMHTSSAHTTVDRLIDSFPAAEQSQIRMMLSESLKGVVAQHLVPLRAGGGRVPALEVLTVIPSVANLIRDNHTYQIPTVIQSHKAQGMRLMDDSLYELYKAGVIDAQEARVRMSSREHMARLGGS